jgi:hypothetical protein
MARQLTEGTQEVKPISKRVRASIKFPVLTPPCWQASRARTTSSNRGRKKASRSTAPVASNDQYRNACASEERPSKPRARWANRIRRPANEGKSRGGRPRRSARYCDVSMLNIVESSGSSKNRSCGSIGQRGLRGLPGGISAGLGRGRRRHGVSLLTRLVIDIEQGKHVG